MKVLLDTCIAAQASQVVRDAGQDVSAMEVAREAGISRGTARRYLEFLTESGSVELTLRYGATGRPEHLYRWAQVSLHP